MGKDPAFLFYPNDYIGGTMGMTLEQKGAYIELLMAQFNRGHMGGHMCGQIVGQKLWEEVKHKFIQDADGLFYNERLELEKSRRQKFTGSRRNNLKGKNQYSKVGHMTSHMENENENSIDTNTIHREGKSELSRNMGFGKRLSESHTQIDHALKTFKNNGMKATKENVLHLLRQFVSEIESKADTKQSYTEFSKHFISWAKMNKTLQLPSTHVRQ